MYALQIQKTILQFFVILSITTLIVSCGKDDIDPQTLCPKTPNISKTVILLDRSDPFQPHQIEALRSFVSSLIGQITTADGTVVPHQDSIPIGHMLVLYELAAEVREPVHLFSMCNPGNPEDAGMPSSLTEGMLAKKVKWLQFRDKMMKAIQSIDKNSTAASSEILNGIRYIRNAEFPGKSMMTQFHDQRRYVLYIISDLLENSSIVSHYSATYPSTSGLPQNLAIDLKGIDIRIRYLKFLEYSQFQTRDHFTWWRKFFAEANSPLSDEPESW